MIIEKKTSDTYPKELEIVNYQTSLQNMRLRAEYVYRFNIQRKENTYEFYEMHSYIDIDLWAKPKLLKLLKQLYNQYKDKLLVLTQLLEEPFEKEEPFEESEV